MYASLKANWPAPFNVCAFTTTRNNGVSATPFDNNLALHVDDNKAHVIANRRNLQQQLNLPSNAQWLNQTHSTDCIIVEKDSSRDADAAITRKTNTVLAIMTADCLPILLCNTIGTEVAAIHAGWRGLLNGVIENTLAKLQSYAPDILAWIGPAICGQCFEVGNEVRELCLAKYPRAQSVFIRKKDKWLFDFSALAEMILNQHQVNRVYQSKACTYERNSDFFSYRRQAQTGRMASIIWFK